MNYEIDINCDLGESYGHFQVGNDDALFPFISSCNIACGFHGGDPVHIERAIQGAIQAGVRIGAHPGYPDLAGFGRRFMQIPSNELCAILKYQIAALHGLTESMGGKLAYVKPHGALYNKAAVDDAEARVVVEAIQAMHPGLSLMGLAGSAMERAAARAGLPFIREGFIDRRYTEQGTLRSRTLPGAMVETEEEAATQAVEMIQHQRVRSDSGKWIPMQVDSLCVHGDNPHAAAYLQALTQSLYKEGISIKRWTT